MTACPVTVTDNGDWWHIEAQKILVPCACCQLPVIHCLAAGSTLCTCAEGATTAIGSGLVIGTCAGRSCWGACALACVDGGIAATTAGTSGSRSGEGEGGPVRDGTGSAGGDGGVGGNGTCGALPCTRIAIAAGTVLVVATAGAKTDGCAELCMNGIRAADNTGDVLVESKEPPRDESEPIEKRDLRSSPPPAEVPTIGAFQQGVSKLPP